MILWLDDIREPWKHGFVGAYWAKSTDDAIDALKTGEVTYASLDHDLSIQATLGLWENERTGYDVIKWMEENKVWPKDGLQVHSMNPVGHQRMAEVIGPHYTYIRRTTHDGLKVTKFWSGTAGG